MLSDKKLHSASIVWVTFVVQMRSQIVPLRPKSATIGMAGKNRIERCAKQMDEKASNDKTETAPSRRRFLKAAAITGVAGAVWSEPLIRGIPAYAADASSITGVLNAQYIFWSPNRDNWDDNRNSASITQSPNIGGNKCNLAASYSAGPGGGATTTTTVAVMGMGMGMGGGGGGGGGGTLSDFVSFTTFGNPDGHNTPQGNSSNDQGCNTDGSNQFPALITLEPQTGCMFTNVTWSQSTTATSSNSGINLVDNGRQIQWDNGTLGSNSTMGTYIHFNIVCG